MKGGKTNVDIDNSSHIIIIVVIMIGVKIVHTHPGKG